MNGIATQQYSLERLTQAELAAECGKSEAWVERKRWDGSGPPFVKIGRTPYYLRKDFHAWLEAQRRSNTHEAG